MQIFSLLINFSFSRWVSSIPFPSTAFLSCNSVHPRGNLPHIMPEYGRAELYNDSPHMSCSAALAAAGGGCGPLPAGDKTISRFPYFVPAPPAHNKTSLAHDCPLWTSPNIYLCVAQQRDRGIYILYRVPRGVEAVIVVPAEWGMKLPRGMCVTATTNKARALRPFGMAAGLVLCQQSYSGGVHPRRRPAAPLWPRDGEIIKWMEDSILLKKP